MASLCRGVFLFVAIGAPAAHAQGAVRGVVYDSIAGAPLAGAVVQVQMVDSLLPDGTRASSSRAYAVVTDANGRYDVRGLPRGRFGVGFQHNALTALGLESPVRAFQLGADTSIVVDLAVPSPQAVRNTVCPAGGAPQDGMLAGFVLDAARGTTLAGASVTVGWVEVGVVEGKLRTIPRRAMVRTDEDGVFRLCGIAGGTTSTLVVSEAGHRELIGEIMIPEGGAARRDFRLMDTAQVAAGSGRVAGRVTHSDGKPVLSGSVSIAALELDAPVQDGEFALAKVPPGTWYVEARVLGYEPQSKLVDVSDAATTSLALKVGPKVQLLETINVVGKPSRDIVTLRGIAERRRRGAGTAFLPGNSWLATALKPDDVLRAARGFGYAGARGCGEQGSKGKRMVAFLDGELMRGGLGDIESLVPMRDVLAIETYPDEQSIPFEYRTANACAAVLVWTRR